MCPSLCEALGLCFEAFEIVRSEHLHPMSEKARGSKYSVAVCVVKIGTRIAIAQIPSTQGLGTWTPRETCSYKVLMK